MFAEGENYEKYKMKKNKKQKMMKENMKKLIIIMIGLFLFSSTLAIDSSQHINLGEYKINTCVNIRQTCATCSFVNFTITEPINSTIVINNQAMNDNGGGVWTEEFCNTATTGRYDVIGLGDLDGSNTNFATFFIISATGTELTTAKVLSYIIILIVSVMIFLGLLFVGIKLPSKNKSDELTGYIIAVSNLKYVKTLILGLSYLSTVWISYFTWMITEAFLDFTFLSSLFKIMFYTLAYSTLPLFILYIYFTITNFIRDKDIADLLLRGLTTK